ncbi:hypothetical protein ASF22_05035 [Methylobacterium sp. Leaf87]|uniref:hypothetical protein n=1 Tax=Methylobacterium sp. Leaf87 TaxID=1736243 RepID=UPI0006FE6874|nr:hypothetical protein [Methylobacterium sp. Leaf87]KQO66035.1 hypothetical protein ASF22_05035 [Methylobacterium sp. Leaf87]
MAPPYKRGFSFSSFQANQPRAPQPGQRLDIEFDEIAGVLTALDLATQALRPLPARSLNVNLLNSAAYPQPVTIDAFKAVLGVQPPLGFTPENVARRGQANGYAPLDANAKVPSLNLPPVDLTGLQPALGFTPENIARRGQANGYAPLDATGRVPLANLPDLGSGGGGTPGPVTSSSITDSSGSGRSVLTGTPAQGRDALQLGAAAILAVGVTGGVASFDDSRFALSAQAATTATLSGLSSSLAGITVKADPAPAWATFKADNNSFLVNLGNAPRYIWPGGGDYAAVSAITGAIRLPREAGDNNINGGPAIIIASGVMGLALTDCLNNVAVGGYFSGGISLDQGRGWAINGTLANFEQRGFGFPAGKNGQLIACELDLNINTPAGGWAGTNAYGASIVCVPQSQPDGGFTAVHISAIDINNASTGRAGFPKVGWKEAIRTDPGACNEFAQIHTVKYPGEGASGSQSLHFISATSNSQFRHGYLALAPDGGFVMQPDYFSGQGSFTVANSNLSAACTIHPTNGFNGPSISVSGNVSSRGSGGFEGNLAVGGLTLTNLLTVNSTATINGDLNLPGGLLSTTRLRFGGRDVQLAYPGSVPSGGAVLFVQT